MFRSSPALLQCLLLAALLIPVSAQEPVGEVYVYVGERGPGAPMVLLLWEEGTALKGLYFLKQNLADIPLRVQRTGARSILLEEVNAGGNVSGTFTLAFAEKDPRGRFGNSVLDKEVLVGSWTAAGAASEVYLSADNIRNRNPGMPWYEQAGASSDAQVERNAQAFYSAVLNGTREAAADLIRYPVLYIGPKTTRTILDRKAFLRLYNSIFVPEYVACVARGIPHYMFSRDSGIMLSDGAVWFDQEGMVKSLIHSDLCKPRPAKP